MSQSSAAVRVPARPVVRPVSRERVQPRLRVVAPAPRRSAGGMALLSVGLLALGLLVLLLLNISIGKGAYALTELQRQQRQLAEEKQSLAEDVAAAGAPGRLAAEAAKLGMVDNPGLAYVDVPDGKVKGETAVATSPPKPKTPRTASRTAADLGAAGQAAVRKNAEKRALALRKAKAKLAATEAAETAAGRTATGQKTAAELTP